MTPVFIHDDPKFDRLCDMLALNEALVAQQPPPNPNQAQQMIAPPAQVAQNTQQDVFANPGDYGAVGTADENPMGDISAQRSEAVRAAKTELGKKICEKLSADAGVQVNVAKVVSWVMANPSHSQYRKGQDGALLCSTSIAPEQYSSLLKAVQSGSARASNPSQPSVGQSTTGASL